MNTTPAKVGSTHHHTNSQRDDTKPENSHPLRSRPRLTIIVNRDNCADLLSKVVRALPQHLSAVIKVVLLGGGNPAGLTRTEIQILRLLHHHKHPKQISRELAISHRTVEKHIEHLRDKLGAHSLRELIKTGCEMGFINGDADP